MEIRSGIKKLGDTEKKYVHMLNSTLCATGRAICCLLETYQEPDGVRVPEVLVPFMGGLTFLPFVRDSRNAPAIPQAVSNKKAKSEKKPAAVVTPTPAPVAAAPTPAAPAPVVAAPVASGPEAELLASITLAGDEVRQLKAAKVSPPLLRNILIPSQADKETIKAKVDELLALKTRYQEMTGGQPAAAAAPAEKAKGEKKEKKESKPKPQKKGLFALSPCSHLLLTLSQMRHLLSHKPPLSKSQSKQFPPHLLSLFGPMAILTSLL
jgi:hypothetical protein